MEALIFGGGGQLGRALAASAPDGVEPVARAHDAVDICDAEAVARAIADTRPDMVFNAAAMTAVDAQEDWPDDAMRINGEAPGLIAAACRDADVHFIHISTDFVFDGAKAAPYKPDDPVNPLSVYGKSKAAGEAAVRAANPEALIVRTAWVYAATGANFVNTMLRLMNERDELGVVADQIGTPTHAVSLAEALWSLADWGATGIHHFTDAGAASWYDFAVAIEEEASALDLIESCLVKPIATADYPTKAVRPASSLLDKTACWAMTGIPRHWRAELRIMLEELKELK